MPRVTITISEQALKQINQVATAKRLSRSTLPQKASSQYLDAKRLEKETNNHKQQMTQAAANMNKPAGKFGKWNGSHTIRRVRDQRAGAKRMSRCR